MDHGLISVEFMNLNVKSRQLPSRRGMIGYSFKVMVIVNKFPPGAPPALLSARSLESR